MDKTLYNALRSQCEADYKRAKSVINTYWKSRSEDAQVVHDEILDQLEIAAQAKAKIVMLDDLYKQHKTIWDNQQELLLG